MDCTLNILFVEDVANDAELIARELSRAGIQHEVRRVENREDFLREVARLPPQIILADYHLPQFSALEALKLLREQNVDIPLILVTGSHSEEIAVECLQAGAEDYILKSSLRRLPQAVRKTLLKKQAERERAAAEIALRRSEEQYRLITENTRDLICLLDPRGELLYISPSFQLVLGHDLAQFSGTRCEEWVHPEDAKVLRETLDEAQFFRESRNTELRFRHRDGHWLNFESAATCIFDESGSAERALLVSRDTGDRKRAEREIRKLAAFPRFNPNPVLEFAEDGSLTYFNDAALEMARSLRRPHPQSILPLNTANMVKQCLATRQNKMHLDGTCGGRMLSWSFFPVPANQVVHCYAEDVTERLNLEAQLRQAQKMESVGQLAAGVAHDFNNILTIIQGHAGLLADTPGLDQHCGESARQIALAGERAASLTRQLLMFSRKQMMQPQLLNLNEVLANVSKMLRTLCGEHVTVKRQSMDSLPPINADPGMMEQILVNLSVNARDAMPRGGALTISTNYIEIDDGYVQRHPEATVGNYVCLSVEDTGHGMEEGTLARIFEPFFTTKEIGKGTGLGLATVYGIVQQHHGWIQVESQVGKGTIFKVFLPVCTAAVAVAGRQRNGQVPGGDETILVVEDEPALRELVQEILERKGYRVLEASTGVQALKIWDQRKNDIDLILTDMMMPEGVSGRDLAQRALHDRPEMRVIYTSGYSLDVVSPDFSMKEGTNFLQKPYDPEMLAQVVRDCLNK